MARFANDPFPGTDYSAYQSWKQVVLPSGEVYYIVPGHPGYVFDPTASNATGRKVFRANPQSQIDEGKAQETEAQRIRDLQDKQAKQAEYMNSPLGQIIPIGGTVAGLWGANQLMNGGAGVGSLLGGGTSAAAAQGATAAIPAAPNVLGASMVSGAPAAAAPATAGLASGYGIGLGPLAAVAGATYLGGQAAYDMFQGKKPGLPGRVVLGMATGGLSEVANHFWGGRETTRDHQKGNTEELLKQSDDPTWQGYVSAMREQNETGPSDASMPYGDSKGNKFANFADYKKSGLDASNLTGVVGNLQTFGPDWAKLSQEQRQKVTQGIIDADLYDSKKGEVVITDPTKAKSIFDSIVAGTQPSVLGMAKAPGIVPVNNATAAAQGALQVVNPARSTTLSPGINLKGQRITY